MKLENNLRLALSDAGYCFADLRRDNGVLVRWSRGLGTTIEVGTNESIEVRSDDGWLAASDAFSGVPERVPLSKCSAVIPWTKSSIYSMRYQKTKSWIVKVDSDGNKLTRIHLIVEPMLRAAFDNDPRKALMTIERIFQAYGLVEVNPERYLRHLLRRSG